LLAADNEVIFMVGIIPTVAGMPEERVSGLSFFYLCLDVDVRLISNSGNRTSTKNSHHNCREQCQKEAQTLQILLILTRFTSISTTNFCKKWKSMIHFFFLFVCCLFFDSCVLFHIRTVRCFILNKLDFQ
jgi:hypothetical protein